MKLPPYILEHAGRTLDEIPAHVARQMGKNPALREEMEQQARIASLIQLKKFESPDEAMFGRVHHRVRIRLANQQSAPRETSPIQLPAWARMVAVVAVMLGLSILTHREMLRAPEDQGSMIAVPEQNPEPPVFPYRVDPSDPFTTYVFALPAPGSTGDSFGLTRQLESDFQSLGLPETNLLETPSLLPVLLPSSP